MSLTVEQVQIQEEVEYKYTEDDIEDMKQKIISYEQSIEELKMELGIAKTLNSDEMIANRVKEIWIEEYTKVLQQIRDVRPQIEEYRNLFYKDGDGFEKCPLRFHFNE